MSLAIKSFVYQAKFYFSFLSKWGVKRVSENVVFQKAISRDSLAIQVKKVNFEKWETEECQGELWIVANVKIQWDYPT